MIRYFLALLLFINFIEANSFELVLNNEKELYNNFEVSYIKDATNSFTIEDIVKTDSFEKAKSNFALGYFLGTFWIKIDIKNQSLKDDFILSINEHFYEIANLYYKENGSWQKKENGIFTSLKKREVQTSKLAFNLTIPKEASKTIYLELKGKYSYFGNIQIYNKEYLFKDKLLNTDVLYIFVFGILFIVIIFNTFLWFSIKERVYLYYVAYTIFALIYFINISGLLVYFDLQYYIYKLHILVAFTIIFLILFSIEYLEAKKYLKYRIKLLYFLVFLLFVFGLMLFYSYTPWNKFINNTIFISLLILISSAVSIYKKGEIVSKYYIFAILLYFVSILIFNLLMLGVFEYSFFTRYSIVFGPTFEIIAFALLLANRYNIIKNEQIKTQNELIFLQQNKNKILEEEVEKKTLTLKNIVKERELLIKEVFHRVKNNFHIVNAFLYFESKKDGNKNRFDELTNRIKSMSLIHEYLCNSKNLVNIDIKEYVNELISNILQTYDTSKIKINSNIENINIEFESIMSLGVIINEIIGNSIKHHKNKHDIIIDISCLKKEENVILKIKDNGSGFDFDKQNLGFGLELICDFVNKLPNGKLNFTKDNGTIFELSFKIGS